MSAECPDAGIPGPQGQSLGPGGLYGALASGRCSLAPTPTPWSLSRWRACVAAVVLCYINLLNYMSWFIVAGILLEVQKTFHISDRDAGLLQTVFISCLLVSAPVFGYLGDRHSRKAMLCFGILLWSGAGLSGSFIPSEHSWLFFLSRGAVGMGIVSYSTIAPTVLGDLFVQDQRTHILAIFYIFIPVGSGLGYMLGSAVSELRGSWPWALRIMPCLEAVALVLLVLLVPDPPQGAAEGKEEVPAGVPRNSWCEDIRYLGRNWSFVWSTLGVTTMAFVTGALGFWAPKFLFEAHVVHGLQLPCFQEPCGSWDSLIFGVLTVVTGIIGVILGAEASRRYKKVSPRAGPLVCASSLLATGPCLYLALVLAPTTLPASYGCLGMTATAKCGVQEAGCQGGCAWWSPRCKPQSGAGFALGYKGNCSSETGLLSLQQSSLCCAFAIVLGGGCFFLTAMYQERDQAQVQAQQSATGILDNKDPESHGLPSGASTSTKEPKDPALQTGSPLLLVPLRMAPQQQHLG